MYSQGKKVIIFTVWLGGYYYQFHIQFWNTIQVKAAYVAWVKLIVLTILVGNFKWAAYISWKIPYSADHTKLITVNIHYLMDNY